MTTHSSVLAWKIPWTEEPGGLQSMGSHRVRHDLATEHAPALLAVRHLPASAEDVKRRRFDPCTGRIPWRRKRQPTTVFLPGKSQSMESQKSQTRLGD